MASDPRNANVFGYMYGWDDEMKLRHHHELQKELMCRNKEAELYAMGYHPQFHPDAAWNGDMNKSPQQKKKAVDKKHPTNQELLLLL
jgi:hypothetical protein